MPPSQTPQSLLGKRLAELIASSGMSAAELARRTGEYPSTISKITLGQLKQPSGELTARIARALGLSPTALGKLLYECTPEYTPPAE